MNRAEIAHVSYIAATRAAVWDALTQPELTQRYWFDTRIESDWQVGSKVLYRRAGRITDEHIVLEVKTGQLLRHTFHPVFTEEYRAEVPSHVTFSLAEDGGVVRLTMVHDGFPPESRILPACSVGWPMILCSLKTMLETGKPLPEFDFMQQSP